MNDSPYKIVWIMSDGSGRHVHYEQYTNRETAEQRLKTLQSTDLVESGVIYYPEDELPIR